MVSPSSLAAETRDGEAGVDFVLLGFGLGALLILIGRAVRAYGPRLRRKSLQPPAPLSAFATAVRWGRVCRAGGGVMTVSGVFLCLITGILLILDASDRSGMAILFLSAVTVLLGLVLWAALFAHPEWRRLERLPGRAAPSQAVGPSGPSTSMNGEDRSVSEAALAAWPMPPSHRQADDNGAATMRDAGCEHRVPIAADDRTRDSGSDNGLAAPDDVESGHSHEPHDAQPSHLPAASKMR